MVKDDNDYVSQVLAGNQQAFTILVDRYKDMVYTIVKRVVGQSEEAEDVAQEVFIKVYHALSRFRMESKFSTWIYRIAYNTAISQIRGRKMEFSESFEEERFSSSLSDDICDDVSGMSHEERLILAQQLIEQLPEGDKLLINLFYMESQSIQQIAEITDLSVSNVKVRLHRVRKRLQTEIQQQLQLMEV